jgi:hypothetical protein
MWPIRVPAMLQRGNNVVWNLEERGKMLNAKDGYAAIRLKGAKKNIKPPKYDQVSITGKGAPVYPVFFTTAGQCFPVKLSAVPESLKGKLKKYYDANGNLKNQNEKIVTPIKIMEPPRFEVVEDASSKNWAVLEMSRINSKYREKEGFLAKYGMYVMNATFAAMVIFFVIYFGGKMEIAASSVGGAAASLDKAITTFFGTPGVGGTATTIPANAPVVS